MRFVSIAVNCDPMWRLGVDHPLPLRCWDGDYVVYNPLSGNTHVLDIVTGEVLKTIMVGEVGTSAVCQHVATYLDVPNDAILAEHVGRILTALDRLALIKPAAGC